MATQLNLFENIGAPIRAATGSFQTYAERDIAIRTNVMNQKSFNFGGGMPASQHTSLPSPPWFKKNMGIAGARRGMRGFFGPGALAFETVIGGAIVAGGAITGSAQWGSPTGLEEDYVGGAVYGGIKGVGHAAGGFAGLVAGAATGGLVGGILGPVGATVGGVVGGIAGSFGGDLAGGALLHSPANKFGIAARAISRTARAVDRIQFGGNFVDSRDAYTMRQRAVQEMSGSMMNARMYLGNEAFHLHDG